MKDNYFVDNAKKCAPPIIDIGTKSKNRCVTLRRRNKWKGYAILPDEAFYPQGIPDATMQTRRNSISSGIALSDKPSNVRRRERYANDPEYREAHRLRTRRNYKSNPVPRKRSKHKRGYDRAYWLRNREKINAKRRERYANDPVYRETHLSKQREAHKAKKK